MEIYVSFLLVGFLFGIIFYNVGRAVVGYLKHIVRPAKNDPKTFIENYTLFIVEKAKENAWDWLVDNSTGEVDIMQINKLTVNTLSDIVFDSFFYTIDLSDDTLKYVSDDEIYDIIKDIIIHNFVDIIDHCKDKIKELDELKGVDITAPEIKKENEDYKKDKSLLDAINMFYDGNINDNDV